MQRICAAALCIFFLFGCTPKETVKNNEEIAKPLTPEYGGTLKIHSYNIDTYNPLFTKSKTNLQMLLLIYDYLITCDNNLRPSGVLASDFFASDNATKWTINIKNGIKWHDGDDLTPYDVASTLNAAKNSAHGSLFKENLSNVEKIDVSGNSVIITLARPQTNFINLLEIPILKSSHADKIEIEKPIGTGRYVFTEKTRKVIYLTSNKAIENTPYIESIEVQILPDKSTAVHAFEAKEIDVAVTDIQSLGDFSSYSQSKSAPYNSLRYNFLAFNLSNEHLSSDVVRTCIAHAINKDRIYEEVLLSKGAITNTFLHPGWWLYESNTEGYEYDPNMAITMLNINDINPNDIKLSILVNNDNKIKLSVADIIIGQLKNIGINAFVDAVPWEQFRSQISAGSYDMYLGEINYSPEINPKYVVPDTEPFTSLLNQLQLQTTDEGRYGIYSQLQQQYAEVLPALPLYFSAEAVLVSNRIHGNIIPLCNNIFFNIHEWFIVNRYEH
jgi:peptide/nickel transport system substrate-binding protein